MTTARKASGNRTGEKLGRIARGFAKAGDFMERHGCRRLAEKCHREAVFFAGSAYLSGPEGDGAKRAGAAMRGFFTKALKPFRHVTPAMRIARGDALFSKAGNLVGNADGGRPPLEAVQALTDALRQYTAAYYKASRAYNGKPALPKSESSEMLALMKKARAGGANCYYGLGRLHERRNEIEEALSYYTEAERVKANAIILNANHPDDRIANNMAEKAGLAIERLRQN